MASLASCSTNSEAGLPEVADRLRQRDSGLTVLRIALEAGFDSKSPFNRAFRKMKGVTPSEYRKQEAGE